MLWPEVLDVAWVQVLSGGAWPEAPGLSECLAQLRVFLLALALRGHGLEGSFCGQGTNQASPGSTTGARGTSGGWQHSESTARLRVLP